MPLITLPVPAEVETRHKTAIERQKQASDASPNFKHTIPLLRSASPMRLTRRGQIPVMYNASQQRVALGPRLGRTKLRGPARERHGRSSIYEPTIMASSSAYCDRTAASLLRLRWHDAPAVHFGFWRMRYTFARQTRHSTPQHDHSRYWNDQRPACSLTQVLFSEILMYGCHFRAPSVLDEAPAPACSGVTCASRPTVTLTSC